MESNNTENSIRWMKHKLMRWGCLFCCIVFLAVPLAGCGSSETDATPTLPPVEVILPEVVPQEGGSFTIVMPETPNRWNPLLTTNREMIDLYGLLYDGLVRYDEDWRPVPGLALNWGLEEDGVTWTFTLREQVLFHGGKAFTSQDVVKTLDFIKTYRNDRRVASPHEWIFDVIDSYSAPDAHTLSVKGKKPGHRVVYAMTFPVLPSDYRGTEEPPPGTGPYRIASLTKGVGATLSSNQEGWRKTPYIPTIEVKAMPDTNTALTSLNVNLTSLIHTGALSASGSLSRSGLTAVKVMTQNYECIVPNVNREGLGDKRMRQALLYALDRGALVTEVYLGGGTLVDGVVPQNSFLYHPTQKAYEYNVNKAKELLADMGYQDHNGDGYVERGDGTPLSYRVIVNENPGSDVRADAARLAKNQWERAGIRIDLVVLTGDQYKTALANGNFDLAFCGFALTGDFDVSHMLKTGGSSNFGRVASSQLNQLLDAYIVAADEGEMAKASQALGAFLVEELPVIGLYFQNNTLYYSNAIKGIGRVRDAALYQAVEQWYCYESGDDLKVGSATTPGM